MYGFEFLYQYSDSEAVVNAFQEAVSNVGHKSNPSVSTGEFSALVDASELTWGELTHVVNQTHLAIRRNGGIIEETNICLVSQ